MFLIKDFRLTTKEHIYIYEDDNIDEGDQDEGVDDGEDMWEDVTGEEDHGEAKSFAENLEMLNGKGPRGTAKEIESILEHRTKIGFDDDDADGDEDKVLEELDAIGKEEEDREGSEDGEGSEDESEGVINVQSSWKNERKNHLVQENTAPNLIRFPVEYRAALEKLLNANENEWILLSDTEFRKCYDSSPSL